MFCMLEKLLHFASLHINVLTDVEQTHRAAVVDIFLEMSDLYISIEYSKVPFTLYRFQMKTVRNHTALAFRLH